MRFPPEAYLIGAEKAGTTSLSSLLDEHPSILVSKPKETSFFTDNWPLGLDWYRCRFPGHRDEILLDATPGYSAAPTIEFPDTRESEAVFSVVAERIHSVRPDAKFIYVLRDPATRMYSAYLQRLYNGQETRGFIETITTNSFYFRCSDYYGQIQQYQKYFSLSSFLFLKFEKMVDEQASAIDKCCKFLGVEPDLLDDFSLPQRNVQLTMNRAGFLLKSILSDGDGFDRLVRVARRAVPNRLKPIAKRIIARRPPDMTEAEIAFVKERLEASTSKLDDLVGIRW